MPHRVFDDVEVRCPMLGGEVSFAYCRGLQDGLPCQRALLCFEREFPVAEFFRRVLREETFLRCFSAPRADRYGSLLAEVSNAKDRLDPDPDPDPADDE